MPTSSKICVCDIRLSEFFPTYGGMISQSIKSTQDINEKRLCHRISQNTEMKNYLTKCVTSA